MRRLVRCIFPYVAVLLVSFAAYGDWVYLPGKGPYVPDLDALPTSTVPPTFTSTGMTLDAGNKKAAVTGRVWYPERLGTKTISKVHWRFGATVTKAGGSTLRVSLQDVLLTGSPPAVPDGTIDQSAVIANADANFDVNTWYPGATLDTGRTVAYADRLAVVWEYETYGGTDSVSISTVSGAGTPYYGLESQPVLFNGSSWAVSAGIPIVMLEFSDGTFGTIEGAVVWSNISSTSFNDSPAAQIDEYGISYIPAFTQKIDGIWGMFSISSASDPDICIYNAAGEMLPGYPVRIRSAAINSYSPRYAFIALPEATLVVGQKYYLTLRATSTTNVTVHSFDVADDDYLTITNAGASVAEVQRLNLGTFTETLTRRPFMGFRLSAVETTSGGLPPTAEHSITIIQ
jgi:hypothetical protein